MDKQLRDYYVFGYGLALLIPYFVFFHSLFFFELGEFHEGVKVCIWCRRLSNAGLFVKSAVGTLSSFLIDEPAGA